MIDIIIFFSFFYILLISITGYGILFQNLCFGTIKSMNDEKVIYLGFYGLFLLTLISLITILFVPHDHIHNIFLHLIGILLFLFIKVKNKKDYLKIISLISIVLISALLISKTHDDFSYYHLPFTKYLTEQKIIFGMANIGHGYKLISSLFFLNSIFYLPFIEYFSFHFSLIFFMIFFNFFLIKEIISKNINEIIKFLYIFALAFFNLSFNRIAEFGTDKAGQLLIVILVIKFFQHVCFDKSKFQIKNILFLVPLLAFCISLKTYFIPYVLIGLTIILLDQKFFKILRDIFSSSSFVIFISFLFLYFLHHFISTGCIISPLSATCFGDNLYWALSGESYKNLSIWLEQWAKAGAGPNFRIEDPLDYIQNFNWISNWIDMYFTVKVFDQLGIMISIFIVVFLFFKNFKFKTDFLFLNKKITLFYIIILTIFFIWFLKHPQLRYGGYAIIFLTISIPTALIFNNIRSKNSFREKFKYFIVIIIVIFNLKNFNRIGNELKRTDLYKFDNFPFFAIPKKDFISKSYPSGLKIYSTKGHCWNTPSPCSEGSVNKIKVRKINGYYFLYK